MPLLRAYFLGALPCLFLTACAESGAGVSSPGPATVTTPNPEVTADSGAGSDANRGGVRARPGFVRSIADVENPLDPFAGEQGQIDSASVMANAVALRYRARFVTGYPGLVEFSLNNTGSGWQEKFLLQLPPVMPTTPVPLLVVFHKYGASHGDVLNTSFLAETQARGWFCVAPLGARQRHFGNRDSQINTRAALDLVAQLFPIDRDRVYGVGFSMGGGALVNYAARHLDPAGIRFAAVCNHTGGVSLAHTWFNEPDDADLDDNLPLPGLNLEAPDILESLFGGTPSQSPFEYQRYSTIDLDPVSGLVGVGTDMGRNLAHIPTATWHASADPLAYLLAQTYAFDAHLVAQNPAHLSISVPASVHSWSTIDETAICDWMQTQVLQNPTSGRTLADEDGTWFYFDVEQETPGSFTPFDWSIDASARVIEVTQSANLARITVDVAAAGIPLTGSVTLRLGTADGTGDRVRVLGVAQAPVSVMRDGLQASGQFDAFSQTYEVVETHSGSHDWILTFP